MEQPHFIFFGEGDSLKRKPPTEEEKLALVDRTAKDGPFSKFVGNDKAVKKIQVAAYHALGHPHHMMRDLSFSIFGPASAGKTTLARIYGEAVRLPFIEISPKGVKTLDDVFDFIDSILTRSGIGLVDLEEGNYSLPPCVLFFDEVHALSDGIIQGLLKATEFGDAMMQTENGRILDTYAATWMIATTDEGKLFDAFRTRFNPVHLQYLGKKDVAKIIKNNHADLNNEVCNLVAHYNPRVPRQALQFARYMKMYKKMHPEMTWKDIAQAVAKDEGINDFGYNEQQMKVLKSLRNGAVSKKNLSTLVGRKEDELENYIIPTLIAETEDQKSLIKSSPRGYVLTNEGEKLLMDMNCFSKMDSDVPSINISSKRAISEILKKLGSDEERVILLKTLMNQIESIKDN